ncbi:hypothetical protein [Actinosynnema mirum]|uniref:DNA-binding protein n=1 Tax=Actinosynnema mirum (strain ATCC 29888 / DSM 43827 / JCM 3225 / NBRC 14064 / NCIMB 13271 / NRRL B-12336 / IMRU 3971 / 101) TaxID=446462 RepID=C6WL95_ACTMD|nr:hypothetical protein [Actinosynnema mirum]ACU36448.1 hypothetical protein Amir_2510 [Actinosynnema mirum DSM 43827]
MTTPATGPTASGASPGGRTGGAHDAVTARRRSHPVLGDRVVVRLVPESLAEAEEVLAGLLGFTPPTRVRPVEGAVVPEPGERSAPGDRAYVEYVLDLVADPAGLAPLVRARPGVARAGFAQLGDLLAHVDPTLLPVFHERAGRVFLAAGSPTSAAAMLDRAREAEREHALPVDLDRARAVFLEFSLAGAVTAKALTAHARSLLEHPDRPRAYEAFFALCVDRVRAGLAPHPTMPAELARLARAAGADVRAEQERLLAAVLACPATTRAPRSFWTHHHAALTRLSARVPETGAHLLAAVPAVPDAVPAWLEAVAASGATAAYTTPAGTAPLPAAHWLSRVIAATQGGPARVPALLDLVEELALRLVADALPVRAPDFPALDLLDLLLARGVPLDLVAGPPDAVGAEHRLARWLSCAEPGRRDLLALAGSEHGVALGAAVHAHLRATTHRGPATTDALREVLAVPGLRRALTRWITARSAPLPRGLPELARLLDRVRPVARPEVFADAPEVAESLAAADVAGALAATLRAGVLDELGWPALDRAAHALGEGVRAVGGEWPELLLRRGVAGALVGPDAVLAEHTPRPPSAKRPQRPAAPASDPLTPVGLPDTAPEAHRSPLGATPWPVITGEPPTPLPEVRAGAPLPGFLADFVTEDADLDLPRSDLRSSTPATTGSPLGESGGRHGWRLRRNRDGSWTGESVTGARTHLPAPSPPPLGLLTLPGGARLTVLDAGRCPSTPHCRKLTLLDPEAVERAELHLNHDRHYAAGTPLLPPLAWWHVLRPRDEPGSAALREVTTRQAEAILAAALSDGDHALPGIPLHPTTGIPPTTRQGHPDPVAEAVTTALPAVTDPALITGVAALARHAATLLTGFRAFAPIAEAARTADPNALPATGTAATETTLAACLFWFGRPHWPGHQGTRPLTELITALGELTTTPETSNPTAPVTTTPVAPAAPVTPAAPVDPAAPTATANAPTPDGSPPARDTPAPASAEPGPAGPISAEPGPAALTSAAEAATPAPPATSGAEAALPASPPTPGAELAKPAPPTTSPLPLGSAGTALGQRFARLAGARAATPADSRPLPPAAPAGWHAALPDLGALLHRAASPLTPPPHRDALVGFLRALVRAGLVDGARRWRVVAFELPARFAPPLHRATPLADGFVAFFERRVRRNGTCRVEGLQFTRTPGEFALPPRALLADAREVRTALTPASVLAFLSTLADRGPAPWNPDAPKDLAGRAGIGTAQAALLLAGLPGVNGPAEHFLPEPDRRLIGLSTAEADMARRALDSTPDRFRRALLAAAVPDDPTALWTTGQDTAAIARTWTAERGRRLPVPDDVLLDAHLAFGERSTDLLSDLANPTSATWLTTNRPRRPLGVRATRPSAGALNSAALTRAGLTSAPQAPPTPRSTPEGFTADHLGPALEALTWLAYRLPAASPLRASLPEALELLRARAAHPKFDTPSVRWRVAAHLEALAEDALTAACAARADTDPDAYFQDPTTSAPHLVTEVSTTLGLSGDAAALYLQLLALPDPTDANTARWTGWKPDRLKRARAELAATDLVVTARRPRAGRALFLPGPVVDPGKPHPPLETWKADLLDPARADTPKRTGALVPGEPVADLFARAWQRVLDGDAPTPEPHRTGGHR